MELPTRSIFLVCFFFLFSYAVKAHIATGDFDAVWQHRANMAQERTNQSFVHNPENVVNQLNSHVHMSRERRLSGASGSCEASNPIDGCWRCRSDWAKNRKSYANCALGFGKKSKGGKDGKIYVVTESTDHDLVNPKKGTLRYGVIQTEPLWIIFEHDMNIKLNGELIVAPLKTIDGRGANVHISKGAGITLQFVHDVIITNLHIHDIKATPGGMIRDSVAHYGKRTESEGDGITIFGSVNIWIDHMSMTNCNDGLIDVVMASTAVTISNCHFAKHDHVMLLGHNDNYSGDKKMQVTIAFNHFGKGLIQRMPRVRYGFAHMLNNDYTAWEMYAIGGSSSPTIFSQGNRFVAGTSSRTKEITKREEAPESEWKNWLWISQGDQMQNGAFFVETGSEGQKNKFKGLDGRLKPKDGSAVGRLTKFAGQLNCEVGRPC